MVVKHKINMDLAGPAIMPRVDMVQNDQYTRQLELTLYENGEAWTIPENANVIICFARPNGTGSDYDTLPSGDIAWSALKNVLTVEIAAPVLFYPGPVLMEMNLLVDACRISTFTILINVHPSVSARAGESDEDFQITAYLPIPNGAEVGEYLKISEVDENGRVLKLGYDLFPSVDNVVNEVLEKLVGSGDSIGGSWGNVEAQTVNITRELTTDSGIRVNFYGNRLRGVSAPKEDTDAANKAYVDQAVGGVVVPSYWQEAVDTAIQKVTAHQDAGGKNCVTFAWFSDSHVQQESTTPNPGYTGALAAAVMKNCRIPFAIMGGDAARSDGNALTSEAQMRQSLAAADAVFEPIGWDKLLQVQGNHDGSWGYDSSLADPYFCYQMDAKSLYGTIFRKQENGCRVFGGDGSYFYVDHPSTKTRFILLNSVWVKDETTAKGVASHRRMRTFGYGNDQLNWLAEKALHFEEDGWAVVLAAHVPPVSSYDATMRDEAVIRGILAAFMTGDSYTGSYGTAGQWDYVCISCDFSAGYNADIVGFFCGHVHKDQVITDELPYPVITITSDANLSYDENEETRVAGTDNEHAIDFVTINRETRTVNLTRLGVGSDRSYTYAESSGGGGSSAGIRNYADPTSADWVNDSRLNSSSAVVTYEGSCVTNWVSCSDGDVIRISGLNIKDATSGYLCYYRNDSQAYESAKAASYPDDFTVDDKGVIAFTVLTINSEVPSLWGGQLRFSGALTAASPEEVIITVNQEI